MQARSSFPHLWMRCSSLLAMAVTSITITLLLCIVLVSLASARSSSSISGILQNDAFSSEKQQLSDWSIFSKPSSKYARHLKSNSSYMSNLQLENSMRALAKECHGIARLYSIGKSFLGVPLWVLEISDKPGEEEPEPSFKYIGNMHGDEPVGRELLLLLANWLCSNYLKDPQDPLADFIVRRSHVHLLPSMNPDGFSMRRRNNANNVDLNRDFPDQFYLQNNNEFLRQPETQAVMNWTRANKFIASASLHGGALVANYPWDGSIDGSTEYSRCPDDEIFRYLATVYSKFHSNMSHSQEFTGGITNGAAWYPLYGGMQDWNYIQGKCLELTLEVSENKWPPPIEVLRIWEDNRLSMLQLIANVIKSGVHGVVLSASTGKPLPAIISVDGIHLNVTASESSGYYHRLLSPRHNYNVTASFPGYISSTMTVLILEGDATRIDFKLNPLSYEHDHAKTHSQLREQEPFRDFPSIYSDNATVSDEILNYPKQTHLADAKAKAEPYHTGIYTELSQHSMNIGIFEQKQLKTSYDTELVADLVTQHLKNTSVCLMVVVSVLCLYLMFRWRSICKLQKLLHVRRVLTL